MKILSKEVLEWTEIDGKTYPKKVKYIVDELPQIEKDPTIELILLMNLFGLSFIHH